MKMRTFIGLCAALAFAAGSTAVHAVKIVGMTGDDPAEGDASVTYAKETLESEATTPASDDSDETTYYNIGGDPLILSAPAEISANAGDSFIASYTLNGMVFMAAPTLRVTHNDDPTDASPQDDRMGVFTIAAKGGVGDNSVVFRATAESDHHTTAYIELNAQFALSGAGSGSVTRVLRNLALEGLGIDSTTTHMAPGIVKAEPALKETSAAMTATADVVASFRKFLMGATQMDVATVGSLVVEFDETHLLAHDADTADSLSANGDAGDAVSNVNQLMNILETTVGTTMTPNSTVSFMGDFSFASMAFLHGDTDCGADADSDLTNNDTRGEGGAGDDMTLAVHEDDILKREGSGEDVMVTGANPVDVMELTTKQYLCIMVSGAEDGPRIEETDEPYTAIGRYMKIAGAAFDPVSVEQTLGRIVRNGTTIRFPFLTSQARYNQVLRITNRGSNARYEFSSSEMDEPMEDALMGGGMTTRLLVRDLIGDGVGEASGTLIIEAQPSTIDAALVHVNRDDSSTDTWIYQ